MRHSNSIPFVLEFLDPEREKQIQDIEFEIASGSNFSSSWV